MTKQTNKKWPASATLRADPLLSLFALQSVQSIRTVRNGSPCRVKKRGNNATVITHLPLPSSHPNLYPLSAAYFTILNGLLGSHEPFADLQDPLKAKSTFHPAFSAIRLILSKSSPVICTGLKGRNGLRFSTSSVKITNSAAVPPIRKYAGNRAFFKANIRFSAAGLKFHPRMVLQPVLTDKNFSSTVAIIVVVFISAVK